VKGDHKGQSVRWIIELRTTLATAAELAERGRTALDPEQFAAPIWSAAARNRDVVARHYHRIDHDLLWQTVAHDFTALRSLLDEMSPELSPPPAR
jgi:uncharacterized protein with HEPN domain